MWFFILIAEKRKTKAVLYLRIEIRVIKTSLHLLQFKYRTLRADNEEFDTSEIEQHGNIDYQNHFFLNKQEHCVVYSRLN